MRDDMFKVIVERPRLGVRQADRIKVRHEHTGKSFVGMKRQAVQQTGWTKGLNENLAPLKRYLAKQVGRQWDDVYSDICAKLDTGSTVKMHVREHLDDFVERKVRIEAGGCWISVGWRYRRCEPQYWSDLYVDPYDGVLRKTDDLRQRLGIAKSRYGREPYVWPEDQVIVDADHDLHRMGGVWYELTLGPRFPSKPANAVGAWVEVLRLPFNSKPRWSGPDYDWRQMKHKRQLGKKELRKFGLKGGEHE